ncbi:MAG: polyphosphate kinase [Crocinitomicaceae bacterium]|nr:polyphosphate kinase [Crocinitomicaceae bacterium]|tara:strand:- start:260 stop:1117 length:858 start_codon:yes stop_codon:yes gene_type:complete
MSVQYFNSEYKNLSDKQYSDEKFRLQVELLKLQEWVVENKKRVAIILEGRDAAGKGSTIKRFIEHLMPKHFRVYELGAPSDEENRTWLKTHEKALPKKGEIVFFDRSWYSRAMIQPTMGYCTKNQYKYFIKHVNEWEKSLINEGLILVKFYLSVNKPTQKMRFHLREKHKLKYWKLSENDLKTLKKWEEYTFYKNQMFEKTSTIVSPWVIINSNNKMVARLNAMRYVLSKIDYKGKNELKKVAWLMDVNNRNIKLFGVNFKDLDDNQYALLSKLKQLETTKDIKI